MGRPCYLAIVPNSARALKIGWCAVLFARTRFVILLALTAFALVALIALEWRSLNAFEHTIERVLHEASVNAAAQTAQQIQADLKSPGFALLDQVDHAAIRRFELPRIAETINAGSEYFRLIDTFFVWSLAPGNDPELAKASHADRVLFYSLASEHSIERMAPLGSAGVHGFFMNPRLASVLLKEADASVPFHKPFALSYLSFNGRTYQVVYRFLFNQHTPPALLGGVEGFLTDAEHLKENYFAELVTRWREKAAKDQSSPSLSFSILDDAGREVTRSGRSLLDAYDAQARFPFLFFDTDLFDALSPYHPEVRYWTVRTGYESGAIASLASQQTMPQRWAWLLASALTAIGIALTARGAAQQMRLSEMKSEFVASVSHDLRTPLAKIQLYADTLEAGRVSSQQRVDVYYRVIGSQAKKLAQLLQELMDFSKIEAGVREYAMEHIDLSDVLRATLETFEQDLAQGWTLEVDLPGAPVHAMANADGLQQVFNNLISNAIKYSGDDRYLRVTLQTVDGYATLDFTDHGIGIPRREHRKIFKKFYRGAQATSAATGSGIGLAIVHHVVRAHGGTIAVASGAGAGTTFTVRLPVLREATEAQ